MFLPRNRFRVLAHETVVAQAIEKYCSQWNYQTQHSLVMYSMSNTHVRLTCTLSRKVSSIPSLRDSVFTDESFPVEELDTSNIRSLHHKQTWAWDNLHNGDSPWTLFQRRRFLRSQRRFSAITFKDDEFFFKISDRCPLPYTFAIEVKGPFLAVYKVGILADHFETAPPRYSSLVRLVQPLLNDAC
jgi:hypothetical protein